MTNRFYVYEDNIDGKPVFLVMRADECFDEFNNIEDAEAKAAEYNAEDDSETESFYNSQYQSACGYWD